MKRQTASGKQLHVAKQKQKEKEEEKREEKREKKKKGGETLRKREARSR